MIIFYSFFLKKVYNSPNTPVLENPEYQTRWYFKYFLGKRESMWYTIIFFFFLALSSNIEEKLRWNYVI